MSYLYSNFSKLVVFPSSYYFILMLVSMVVLQRCWESFGKFMENQLLSRCVWRTLIYLEIQDSYGHVRVFDISSTLYFQKFIRFLLASYSRFMGMVFLYDNRECYNNLCFCLLIFYFSLFCYHDYYYCCHQRCLFTADLVATTINNDFFFF